jgi:D-arabinose 1-dehydrogenase-like Zn-dependent alcohol dehydrogenase
MLNGVGAVVLETDPARRDAAMTAGALAAFDPKEPEVLMRLKEAMGGTVLNILDLVGSAQTASFAIDALDKNGHLVIVGLFGGAMQLSVPLVPMKSLTIQGGYVGTLAELRELVDLVRVHGLPSTPIDIRPLSHVAEAMAALRSGKIVGRLVLVP